jgi:uncharacterized damage-inducible protein DinB
MPKIRLILTRPLVAAQHVELEGERVTLGRSKSCTCLIEDRFLSRTHAELVPREGRWFLRDCDSANGTFVNGARIDREVEFRYGDTITMGDTEIRMGGTSPQDEITQVGLDSAPTTPPAPAPQPEPEPEQVPDLVIAEDQVKESADQTMLVHRLALELLADRSMDEMFEIIVDHVMEVMKPSRVVISLLGADGKSLENVRFRTGEKSDESRLTISRTLLEQIVEERKVVAYTDIGSEDGEVPESMTVEGIFSALGAPLLVNGHVLGVLYLDYRLTDRVITEEDAQLAAQIARVAAIKVESSRARERRGMNKSDLLDLYAFNEWANEQFMRAVGALGQDVVRRDLGGSHRSIRDALAHIVATEWVWLERWDGNSPTVAPDWVEGADVPVLREALAEVERGRAEYFDQLEDEKLRQPLSFTLMSGERRSLPLVDLILHVVDHSTYHRGQLATMMRQCGVAPPSTAFIEYRRSAATVR